MKQTVPRWNLVLVRASAVVSCLAFAADAAAAIWFPNSYDWERRWNHFLGAFTIYAIGLLLVASLLCFWGHRRAAVRGLWLAVTILLLSSYLFPEL